MGALALLAASLLSAAAPLPDPLGPASDGQLQCYAPDTARKTCLSLAAFADIGQGRIETRAEVLVSDRPALTMEASTPVQVADGQVCGALREEDIAAASFRYEGVELDDSQAEVARTQAYATLRRVIGKRICARFIPQGATMLAKATLDGAPQPAMDQTVIWVSPNQGYSVAP